MEGPKKKKKRHVIERTRLIRLRPLLQPIYVVIKVSSPPRPFLEALLLYILVISLEQFFVCRSDVLNKRRTTDAYHRAAIEMNMVSLVFIAAESVALRNGR